MKGPHSRTRRRAFHGGKVNLSLLLSALAGSGMVAARAFESGDHVVGIGTLAVAILGALAGNVPHAPVNTPIEPSTTPGDAS